MAGSMPGNTGILWGWLLGDFSDCFSSSSDSSLLGDFSSVAKKRALMALAAPMHRCSAHRALGNPPTSPDNLGIPGPSDR